MTTVTRDMLQPSVQAKETVAEPVLFSPAMILLVVGVAVMVLFGFIWAMNSPTPVVLLPIAVLSAMMMLSAIVTITTRAERLSKQAAK